jgi:hypothetical protein
VLHVAASTFIKEQACWENFEASEKHYHWASRVAKPIKNTLQLLERIFEQAFDLQYVIPNSHCEKGQAQSSKNNCHVERCCFWPSHLLGGWALSLTSRFLWGFFGSRHNTLLSD